MPPARAPVQGSLLRLLAATAWLQADAQALQPTGHTTHTCSGTTTVPRTCGLPAVDCRMGVFCRHTAGDTQTHYCVSQHMQCYGPHVVPPLSHAQGGRARARWPAGVTHAPLLTLSDSMSVLMVYRGLDAVGLYCSPSMATSCSTAPQHTAGRVARLGVSVLLRHRPHTAALPTQRRLLPPLLPCPHVPTCTSTPGAEKGSPVAALNSSTCTSASQRARSTWLSAYASSKLSSAGHVLCGLCLHNGQSVLAQPRYLTGGGVRGVWEECASQQGVCPASPLIGSGWLAQAPRTGVVASRLCPVLLLSAQLLRCLTCIASEACTLTCTCV